MIKILHSLFSSFLGSRSAEYLPCHVLFENSNGKSGYFDLVWFWPFAIARFKKDRAHKKWVGTSQPDKRVTSYSHRIKTSWLVFYAILREVRRLRRSFLVFTTSKMFPRRRVVQYCSRVSDKELGISMNTSPSSVTSLRSGKDLSLNTEKASTLPVRLGYARCISKLMVLPV